MGGGNNEMRKLKEVPLGTWEEFEAAIISFFQKTQMMREQGAGTYVSAPLFRGHENASWKLDTTLERFSRIEYKMSKYHTIMQIVEPAVESFTGTKWELPEYQHKDSPTAPPGSQFMVYLRHNGFPSPLLDWSRSPYVAAFFAFRAMGHCQHENVAIYSYLEHCGHGKTGNPAEPTILTLGPCIATHKRHHIQQCEYSICRKVVDNQYVYCNHEGAFGENDDEQDQLTKFLIPRSERAKVMEKLDFMNINAYSLFGTEESLAETLAYREIERNTH